MTMTLQRQHLPLGLAEEAGVVHGVEGSGLAVLTAGMKVLRPYQKAAIKRWIDNKEKGIVSLPTGSGKTLIGIAVIGYALSRGYRPVVILVPTNALVERWRSELEKIFGRDAVATYPTRAKPIVVMTYARADMEPEFLREAGLVIVDEAHHMHSNAWYRLVNILRGLERKLGLTAESPENLHASGAAETFGGVVYAKSLQELVGSYLPLPEPEIREYPGGDVNTVPAETVATEVKRLYGSGLRKVIVFANTYRKAREIAEALRRLGLPVYEAYGRQYMDPRELAAVLRRFRDAPEGVLVGTTVLDEGIDIPTVDAAVIATPTRTHARTIQRIGRALRVAPGKYRARIVFLVPSGNSKTRRFVEEMISRLKAEVPDVEERLTNLLAIESRRSLDVAVSYPAELARMVAEMLANGSVSLDNLDTRRVLQMFLYYYYLQKRGDPRSAYLSWRLDIARPAKIAPSVRAWLAHPDIYDYPGVDAGDQQARELVKKLARDLKKNIRKTTR